MIYINTDGRTAGHVAAMQKTIATGSYAGPAILEVAYRVNGVDVTKTVYAHTSPPPGEDDGCLFLDTDRHLLFRVAPGDGYTQKYEYIGGYFTDSIMSSPETLQTYIDTQLDTNTAQIVTEGPLRPAVATLDDLRGYDNSRLMDKTLIYVEDAGALYHYDRESVAPDDGVNVIHVRDGYGRWVRVEFDGTIDGGQF